MQIFYSLYFKTEDFARLAVCGGKAKKFLSSHFIIGAKFLSRIFSALCLKKNRQAYRRYAHTDAAAHTHAAAHTGIAAHTDAAAHKCVAAHTGAARKRRRAIFPRAF